MNSRVSRRRTVPDLGDGVGTSGSDDLGSVMPVRVRQTAWINADHTKYYDIMPILNSFRWLKIIERIEYKLLSLTWKVLTTSLPTWLPTQSDLCSIDM